MNISIKRVLILIIIIIFPMCTKTYKKESSEAVARLSLKQKVGQMIMTAFPGAVFNDDAAHLIKEYLPGGIILFGYNLDGRENIARLIASMQVESMQDCSIPLFVSIDQEGGRVKRIRQGVTQFPGNMAAGVSGDGDLVYQWARVLGTELRQLGVNMNLAPVVDISNNPDNPVINSRSFGSNPDIVAELGKSYIRGLQDARCIAVAKHFPGHGDTNRDSHKVLPVIPYGMDRLTRIELYPFREAIKADVECIMSAHISYPEILKNSDSATISPFFLTELLRNEMKFEGLVITDDMEMNAISKEMDIGEAAVKSVLAGADIVLISSYGDNIPLIVKALIDAVNKGVVSRERLDSSVRRIIAMKLRYGIAQYNKKEKTITRGDFVSSEEDSELLENADRINTRISKGALYYYGDSELLTVAHNKKFHVYTDSPTMKSILHNDKSRDITVHNTEVFTGKDIAKLPPRDILVYYTDTADSKALKKIHEVAASSLSPFILLSGGNPFPVARCGLFNNVLFSFSNTEESIRQLALCLTGRFEPRKNININLGFRKTQQ